MYSIDSFSRCVIEVLTDQDITNSKIISVNNKSLSDKGDLSFPLNINNWRGYVSQHSECFKNSKTILDYYQLRQNNYAKELLSNDTTCILLSLKNAVVTQFKKYSDVINFSDFEFEDKGTFISINFNRNIISYRVISSAIDYGFQQKVKQSDSKKFYFQSDKDDSEITNLRINLIKKVTENLLNFLGYTIENQNCDNNYIFTSKSLGKINSNFDRYLCGAVLNGNKKKEKVLTEQTYFEKKFQKVKILNSSRCYDEEFDKDNFEKDVVKIANSAVNYELLSVKHISPVILECSNNLDRSLKEASFILYNYARMTAILNKYNNLVLENKFPEVLPIRSMQHFCKVTNYESWSLIYNYIVKYPDLIKTIVTTEPKLDVNISLLWTFISSMCHDFSKYYRKSRILIKATDWNNEIIEITSEKLYMVRALRIVLKSSLSLLNIEEVKSM